MTQSKHYRFLLTAWALFGATAALAASGFSINSGTLIDDDGDAIYVMQPEGGIQALRTANGSAIWASSLGDKPLAVSGDRLITQHDATKPGRLEIAVLRVDNGELIKSFVVPIPNSMTAHVADGLYDRFRASATADGDDIYVKWEHTQLTRRSQVFAEKHRASPQIAQGAARIRFATAQVESIPREQFPDPLDSMPASVRNAAQNQNLVWEPIRTGNVIASTLHVDTGVTMPTVRLLRWRADNGLALTPKDFNPKNYVFHRFSADGKSLMIGQTDPQNPAGYMWQLFDVASGVAQGSVKSAVSTPPHAVAGNLILFESMPKGSMTGGTRSEIPRQLTAMNMDTGQVAWMKTIRDTEFRGPFPP